MNVGIWVYAIFITVSLLLFIAADILHRREVIRLSKKVEKLLKK